MSLARRGADVSTRAHAWREFTARRSPKLILLALVLVLAVRVALGAPD